jgi:hypothetical protein
MLLHQSRSRIILVEPKHNVIRLWLWRLWLRPSVRHEKPLTNSQILNSFKLFQSKVAPIFEIRKFGLMVVQCHNYRYSLTRFFFIYFLFHWIDVKLVTGPDQVYFSFSSHYQIWNLKKHSLVLKIFQSTGILELLPSGRFFICKLPILALHRIIRDSSGHFHLMDEESTGWMVILPGITSS